jgi:hypothetical protein
MHQKLVLVVVQLIPLIIYGENNSYTASGLMDIFDFISLYKLKKTRIQSRFSSFLISPKICFINIFCFQLLLFIAKIFLIQ